MKKVLIADDHSVVRAGLKDIIRDLSPGVVIEEVTDGQLALDKIENDKFDLIILDISMPGKSGLNVLEVLRNRNRQERVLMLSMHSQEQYAIRAFKLGASGYLSKDSAPEELAQAIRKIMEGGKYISQGLAEKLIFDQKPESDKAPHELLSDREFQVMCMIAQGNSLREIGEQLSLSEKTVSTYRTRILEKMDMKSNADLILYAIRNGLIA